MSGAGKQANRLLYQSAKWQVQFSNEKKIWYPWYLKLAGEHLPHLVVSCFHFIQQFLQKFSFIGFKILCPSSEINHVHSCILHGFLSFSFSCLVLPSAPPVFFPYLPSIECLVFCWIFFLFHLVWNSCDQTVTFCCLLSLWFIIWL